MIPANPKILLSFPLLIVLAACAGTPEPQDPTPTRLAEREPATELPSFELSGEELSDDVATGYMYDLSSRDRDLVRPISNAIQCRSAESAVMQPAA